MGKLKSVRQYVQKAVKDSIEFSEKNKGEIFVSYHPHVNMVNFHAYKNGWEFTADADMRIDIYIKGSLAPKISEIKQILKPLYNFMKDGRND